LATKQATLDKMSDKLWNECTAHHETQKKLDETRAMLHNATAGRDEIAVETERKWQAWLAVNHAPVSSTPMTLRVPQPSEPNHAIVKKKVKDLGAKWDPQAKAWMVPPNTFLYAFAAWL
jgi:hypothetical protein